MHGAYYNEPRGGVLRLAQAMAKETPIYSFFPGIASVPLAVCGQDARAPGLRMLILQSKGEIETFNELSEFP